MNLRIYFLICALFAVSSSWSEEVPFHGILRTEENAVVITLSEAIEMALEHNEGILAARDAVKEAEAGVVIARSGFLPQISAQGSYTRLAELPAIEMEAPKYGMMEVPVFGPMGDTIGFTVVPGIIGTDIMKFQMGEEENYITRASLQQPLCTWGKISNGYQIAKLNVEASQEDYRKHENELVFNVTKSFYGILVIRELVKLTEDAYKQTANHVDAVEERYKAGVASNFDLLRAKVQLKNMEPQVIRVKNGLELAKTGFKTLLGLPQDTMIKLKGELEYKPIKVDLVQSIEEALVNRPETKALELRKEMAGTALAIAKKANWPNIALIANYDYKKPLYFKNEWGTDWNITVALQMPIFTGLGNRGKISQASCRLSQAEHGLKLLKEGIEMEVRASYLQLEEARKLVESQKENIAQAEEALSIVEERYKQGLATNLEVMDTQLAVTKAKANYLQALSDYVIAKAKLEKAIGKQ
jgi:outer membrane protein TolC